MSTITIFNFFHRLVIFCSIHRSFNNNSQNRQDHKNVTVLWYHTFLCHPNWIEHNLLIVTLLHWHYHHIKNCKIAKIFSFSKFLESLENHDFIHSLILKVWAHPSQRTTMVITTKTLHFGRKYPFGGWHRYYGAVIWIHLNWTIWEICRKTILVDPIMINF